MGDEIREALERLMPPERAQRPTFLDSDQRLERWIAENRKHITLVDWYPEPTDYNRATVLLDERDLTIWIEQPSRARAR